MGSSPIWGNFLASTVGRMRANPNQFFVLRALHRAGRACLEKRGRTASSVRKNAPSGIRTRVYCLGSNNDNPYTNGALRSAPLASAAVWCPWCAGNKDWQPPLCYLWTARDALELLTWPVQPSDHQWLAGLGGACHLHSWWCEP